MIKLKKKQSEFIDAGKRKHVGRTWGLNSSSSDLSTTYKSEMCASGNGCFKFVPATVTNIKQNYYIFSGI